MQETVSKRRAKGEGEKTGGCGVSNIEHIMSSVHIWLGALVLHSTESTLSAAEWAQSLS